VRTERIAETSPDGLAHLEVDLPVLAGDLRPAVRDRINQALREAADDRPVTGTVTPGQSPWTLKSAKVPRNGPGRRMEDGGNSANK
jgi:hypothetical protein